MPDDWQTRTIRPGSGPPAEWPRAGRADSITCKRRLATLHADAGELLLGLHAGDLDPPCEDIFASLFQVEIAESTDNQSDDGETLRCARLWGSL
jgi:hypothetical protein